MKKIFIFLIILFLNSTVFAASMFERRIYDGRLLFDIFVQQNISRDALNLIFRIFDYNQGRIENTNYAVLIDYSLPSTEKRLFLLDLTNGYIQRFYVAHGIRSGVVEARSFSNRSDSWKSSLGFYYAKGSYLSDKNGLSLYLDGIDKSNNNTRARNIVLHGARYVSDEFIQQNGRLGWSEGCFAVSLEDVGYLVDILQPGSILFSYHKDLISYSRRSPNTQQLNGKENIPAGVNTYRTPGEGGGVD